MEYKFKAGVKPVIENGEVICTGCVVDVWEIDFKRRKIIYYDPSVAKKEELNFDEIELLPYTGVKDKNGKEIYKANIVLYDRNIHKDIDTAKFKVVWAKDRYVLQETKHKHYIDDVTWELVEVIGNIYENPELLEG